MNKADMIKHNEALAAHKIREAYKTRGLTEAMELCKTFTGLGDLKSVYNKTCGICFDLIDKKGRVV